MTFALLLHLLEVFNEQLNDDDDDDDDDGGGGVNMVCIIRRSIKRLLLRSFEDAWCRNADTFYIAH